LIRVRKRILRCVRRKKLIVRSLKKRKKNKQKFKLSVKQIMKKKPQKLPRKTKLERPRLKHKIVRTRKYKMPI